MQVNRRGPVNPDVMRLTADESDKLKLFIITAVACLLFFGCNHPLGTPDLTGFAPWERLPDGDGITYVHKFRTGHSMNPTFLAMFRYENAESLTDAVDVFQLVPLADGDKLDTWTANLKSKPDWFPIENASMVFEFPKHTKHGYMSNLWVDENKKLAVIERTWY